jgi:flagellar hook-basal body protein
MSFYTSLTGLNAATAQLGVTSNNIANVSTTGFKRSRTDFGDIFATSPLQKASATIGQGVSLKRVVQEFGQGNMMFSSNTLDLAISGDGFFPLKSQDGFQDIFTRNGVFMMNDQYNVVNSAGQKLMAASVDSSGKANLDDMNVLTIPQKTTGMAKQTSKVQLGLNFPADAEVISKEFNRNDPETYNKSTALTVYDAGGNSYLASVYYVKTQDASQASPNNKWQTYVYVGDKLVNASLQQATNSQGEEMYVNKYGELKAKSDFKTPEEIAELNSSFAKKTIKFSLDELTDIRVSQPAAVTGGLATDLGTGSNDGIDFANYMDISKSDLLRLQGSSSINVTLPLKDVVGPRVFEFGEAGKVTITGSTTTEGPTLDEVVSQLNNNAGFAGMYVAQAATPSYKITGIADGGLELSPFNKFNINLGGQELEFKDLPKDIEELQAYLETKINVADGMKLENAPGTGLDGDPRITVSFEDGVLTVNDTMGRNISGMSLTVGNPATGVTAGTAEPVGDGLLKITAIDPNVNVKSMIPDSTNNIKGISVKVNGEALVAGDYEEWPTEYDRAKATYTSQDAAAWKVAYGSMTPIEDASLSGLVQKLNKDTSFSVNYLADIVDSSLVITAKDPMNLEDIFSDNLVIYTKVTEADPFIPLVKTAAVDSPIKVEIGTSAIYAQTKKSIDDLKNLFQANVDGSNEPVVVGLDHLLESMAKLPESASKKLSGTQIAQELTNVMARQYGDEKPFNFASIGSTTDPTFSLTMTTDKKVQLAALPIYLAASGDMKTEELVRNVQKQIDASVNYSGQVEVSYDTQKQQLVFAPKGNAKIAVSSDLTGMDLADPLVQGVNDASVGLTLTPSVSTSTIRPSNDQRYGMKVEYDSVKQTFVFKSGTTGDASSIAISNIRPGSLATQSIKGLGMTGDPASYVVSTSTVDALRGITSEPAVLTGNALAVNVDNNFSVDETNNQFVVSVNGITGTVVVPPKDTYTMGTFMEALQNGINNLQGPTKNGLTADSVNGVKVSYDADSNALKFTTGTASTDSYVKITGDARWGLDGLDAAFGSTTSWIKPTAFKDEKGATVYVDGFGDETSTAAGFETLPAWSPVYFDKGELTFDTAGNLVSPKQGAQLDTVYLPNGKGALTINIDYSKSTQFASPFSVLSQSQDGAPEGDLVGLAIADDGLVSASFSNGAQKSLGKVVLVNFSNPSGLRQIGDTNYYKTSDSGTPKYGEAGSAGFGTVRSGATERANVDLTQELVDLITEQRNFQANAKAMETSTSMTQTIIQIRN